MSIKAGNDRQTQQMQQLCADIVQNSVGIRGVQHARWWCTRASKLVGLGTTYAPYRSALVKAEILQKLIVSSTQPLAQKLPADWFEKRHRLSSETDGKVVTVHIFAMKDMKRLKELSKSAEAAEAFLGIRIMHDDAGRKPDFQGALDRVRAEINNHPDPGVFFVKVINSLVPGKKS